jgi:hypothetical protein
VRYAGAAMGLAMSLRLWTRISKKQPKQKQQTPLMVWAKGAVLTMTLTLAFGQMATYVRGKIPASSPDELTFFYIANYVLNCILVFSIAVISPYITNFVLHSKDSDK